jgi:excisionase family DNA binding protein
MVNRRSAMQNDRLLTVNEVAALLRVDPETVRRMLRSGRLRGSRPVSPRAGWIIPESEVQRVFEEGKAAA